MTKKKALITGGNGFIGSNLTRALKASGYYTRVAYLEGTDLAPVEKFCDEAVVADIATPDTLPPAVEDIDVVFHLAAIASDWGPHSLFDRVNHRGTANMLEAAVKAGVRRFVHTSSVAVHRYRDFDYADENTPRDADYPHYATTKIAAEDAVNSFSDRIETVIVRPGTTPYGPGDVNNLARIFDAIEKGFFGLVDGGKAKFSTSYVDNLSAGYILAAEHEKAPGETFIVCDDEPISWRRFIDLAAEKLKVKSPKLSLPYWLLYPPTALVESAMTLLKTKNPPLLTRYRLNVTHYNLVFSNDNNINFT